MTTSYERGRAIEYRIQKELEAVDYTTARAAGSKGKFDVLAWDDHIFRIIQAKSFIKRPGSFNADVTAIRAIQVPPGTRREFWIWKHRQGWQVKILLGDHPEEDCVLPIAEAAHGSLRRYEPSVIRADGRRSTLHQPLPLLGWSATTFAEDRELASRRAYGSPITFSSIGDQPMRDVLRDVRAAIEEARLEPVLQREVPTRRKKPARGAKD